MNVPRDLKRRTRRAISKGIVNRLRRTVGRWAKKIEKDRREGSGINESTREAGYGHCLNFDVASARAHGFSPVQIERIGRVLKKLAAKECNIAHRRFPDRYKNEGGTVVFVGPCCVCDDGRKKKELSERGYCFACEKRWIKPGKAEKKML